MASGKKTYGNAIPPSSETMTDFTLLIAQNSSIQKENIPIKKAKLNESIKDKTITTISCSTCASSNVKMFGRKIIVKITPSGTITNSVTSLSESSLTSTQRYKSIGLTRKLLISPLKVSSLK